jgi:hypothetical protein
MTEMPARDSVASSSSPRDILRETNNGHDTAGDAADQAERLRMIMEAEAVHSAMNGGGGEGSLEGLLYPLEDLEDVLSREDADDSSDDPMHSGGLTPKRWVTAEEAAMHVVDAGTAEELEYADDETAAERADPDRDQFDGPVVDLTPEDETLLGVDPYDD